MKIKETISLTLSCGSLIPVMFFCASISISSTRSTRTKQLHRGNHLVKFSYGPEPLTPDEVVVIDSGSVVESLVVLCTDVGVEYVVKPCAKFTTACCLIGILYEKQIIQIIIDNRKPTCRSFKVNGRLSIIN